MAPQAADTSPRATHAHARVLETFLDCAPQIAAHERFTRHLHPGARVDWDGVLAEDGWSDGQRLLIQLAAAPCGNGRVPPEISART